MKDRMYEVIINMIDDVKTFVSLANKFEGSIRVCSEEYTVDGKSLLGVFSLDLTKPVKVYVSPTENDTDALKSMELFARDCMPLFVGQ